MKKVKILNTFIMPITAIPAENGGLGCSSAIQFAVGVWACLFRERHLQKIPIPILHRGYYSFLENCHFFINLAIRRNGVEFHLVMIHWYSQLYTQHSIMKYLLTTVLCDWHLTYERWYVKQLIEVICQFQHHSLGRKSWDLYH